MANKANSMADNDRNVEASGKRLKEKIRPEEKVKQERIISYLRDVLGYKLMDFEMPVKFGRMTTYSEHLQHILHL